MSDKFNHLTDAELALHMRTTAFAKLFVEAAAIQSLLSSLDAARAEAERFRAALEECEEYCDNRADAETFADGTIVANAEMRLLVLIRAALGARKPAL